MGATLTHRVAAVNWLSSQEAPDVVGGGALCDEADELVPVDADISDEPLQCFVLFRAEQHGTDDACAGPAVRGHAGDITTNGCSSVQRPLATAYTRW